MLSPTDDFRDPTTRLLKRWSEGDVGAREQLLPLVYDELHRLAERHMSDERSDHTLQATALVHEAWLKLARGSGADWQDRQHFLAVASRAMRRVLVDHARTRGRQKRGGKAKIITLEDWAMPAEQSDEILLRLEEALEQLEEQDEQLARIVEFRFFGGMTREEIAGVLDVSVRTVGRGWRVARAWLHAQLSGTAG